MLSVGKLFAIAAIAALVLGVARWPASGTGFNGITIKNRVYGFGPDTWAFSVGAIFALFAAFYYWFPILFSRSLGSRTSHLHFWLSALAAFGFLVLAPGLQALSARRDAAVSEGTLTAAGQRAMMAALIVLNISPLLFLLAQAIFLASLVWSATYAPD
jgi:heme/copper-type cytochrome/quinol oxidase subunit 1